MPQETWESYTALIARRADERERGAAVSAGSLAGSAEMTTHADELGDRLDQQAADLFQLARALRVRAPAVSGLPPGTPGPDAPEALPPDAPARLTETANAIDRADALAREAEAAGLKGARVMGGAAAGTPGQGGAAPVLGARPAPEGKARKPSPARTPSTAPGVRNVLVYLAAAALTMGAQFVTFLRTGDQTSWWLVLFVQPLVGFFLGWSLLRRMDRSRSRGGGTSPRLGLVLCLAAGPATALLMVLR